MRRFRIPTAVLAVSLIVVACTKPLTPNGADATPGTNTEVPSAPAGSQQADWAAIEKLEAEAKTLARTEGCSTAGECRSAPVGSRACGGPRYYLPYCAKATDSVALYRKLDEVAAAERAYNTKYELVSTCEFRMPSPLVVSGGSCREQ